MAVRPRPLAAAVAVVLTLTACGDSPVLEGDPPEDAEGAAEVDADVDADAGTEAAPAEEPADTETESVDEAAITGDFAPAAIGTCEDLAGYTPQDATALSDATLETLQHDGGAMRPDSAIGPLTKALLVLEANEAPLERVRYRLRYGVELRDAPPAADPVEVSFVQVDRFNLGPAIRAELIEAHGEDAVGGPEEFGTGPHVSYCLLMRPLMGQQADVLEASRAEIPDAGADDLVCLGGVSCTSPQPAIETATDWEDTGEVGFPLDVNYQQLRGGVPSPAAAMDLALVGLGVAHVDGGRVTWTGFEPRHGVVDLEEGQPFVDAVIEFGLGQDHSVDAAIREGAVMDHTMEAAWQRIVGFPSGDAPFVSGAWASEGRGAG